MTPENQELSLSRAKEWSQHPAIDQGDRDKISQLLDSGDQNEILECFLGDLEFGTGGLRSPLGLGPNRLNKYTIKRAALAVANRIKSLGGEHRFVISYDCRHFSLEFAKEVAAVMAGEGIKTFLYQEMRPVCFLSFALRELGCTAGAMVTASHNPPEYNGFKVFWSDGAQVTPPNDELIIQEYAKLEQLDVLPETNFDKFFAEKKIEYVPAAIENKYYDLMEQLSLNSELIKEHPSELKIVYTPLHGTGHIPTVQTLKKLGFENVHIVQEQIEPNGDFPTVKSPNPEDPEALAMAVEQAKKIGGDIVMGSDPDADRLGVAVAHKGTYAYPNGHQLGCLYLDYILRNLSEKKAIPQDSYVVKTIVTSRLQDRIISSYGVETMNTLTGFKWICRQMKDVEEQAPHKNFVFATEESFGFLNHSQARDKDGISSLALMAEMALFYKLRGKTLIDALEDIWNKYGHAGETLLNYNFKGLHGRRAMNSIMDQLRNSDLSTIFPNKVVKLEDYLQGHTKLADGGQEDLAFPKSNVLGFFFANGTTLYARPSGTEPKIKFYAMTLSKQSGQLNLEQQKLQSQEILSKLKVAIEKLVDSQNL